jgi:flavorubredoxin
VVPLNLPNVGEIQLDNIQFYVVTEENAEVIFKELREKNYDPVIFGVTDDGYEMMSTNMAKILQLVQQQKAVIIAYGEYYDKQNNAVKENNESARSQKEAADALQKEGGGISTNESFLEGLWPW